MLSHNREYSDGKYLYAIIVMEDRGNVIVLENQLTKDTLKRYHTEDDEAAIAIFESMIELQDEKGDQALENYKINEMLAKDLSSRVRVDHE